MARTKPIFAQDEDRKLDGECASILRKLRLEAGLSQKSLAISLGVTNSYLCDIEKGNRTLRISFWNRAVEIINRELGANKK